MADARMRGRTPVIAVALAVTALVTALVAVIVVATRAAPVVDGTEGVAVGDRALPSPRTVRATEVVRLDRDVTETVTAGTGAIGIKVTDPALREVLGLEATDVVTAISGRVVTRPFDVYDALLGASTMKATTLYVDVLRAGAPVLLRWQLEGDLRTARSDARSGARSGRTTTGGLFGRSPPSAVAPVSDPLVDSITKLDELHYEVPRATLDQLLASPAAAARSARVVPTIKNGVFEGVKLFAIRPRSALAAVGFANGDTIRAINGQALTSLDDALAVFTRAKHARELTFELLRRGQPTSLTITITP